MEAAIGVASGIIGSVLNQLSDEFVDAYVASKELGLNSEKIKDDLMLTHGLLHEAQRRAVSDNLGLQGLLQRLRAKANEAEDALDELHYFIIQDRLDGTKYAVPDLGDGLRGHARHGRHAARYTVRNCLNCFCCSPMQDDGASSAAVTNNQHSATNLDRGHNDPVDRLAFNRVVMSKKIKSVIEETHSLCEHVFKLLNIIPNHSDNTAAVTLRRPHVGSTTLEDRMYGRSAIFEHTIKDMTGGTYHDETLFVLPIVGPGGIGKTTFTQHLYNDKRTRQNFTVRVWICVSTDFDVLKLTQQIHNCIPATENEEINTANGQPSLDQLQIAIARRLRSKRFLIVLDDMWKCDTDDEWKSFLAPFTNGEARGSTVIVTTRFPKISERVKRGTIPLNLQGLDPQEFFEFFKACVFGQNIPDQQYNELIDIGREIAQKLKCSPLAAKTVARLLKKHLSWEHWRKVLENNEWRNEANADDIMPALKISYDYLPFHLKQCFSYLSLFPEDYKFNFFEITRFWTAIGIIDSSYKNQNYLEELVDNGFLMKEAKYDLEDPCYVMHDLFHELSQSVSSQDCFNISSLSFSSDAIPKSILHLSITIEHRYDDDIRKQMAKLKSRINIRKLRTLMFFHEYGERICEILKDTFNEIECLRVLFIVMESPESLPKNFSKLLHLRYLKLRSSYSQEITLPSTLSRFYHLIFLDLQGWCGSFTLPKYITRLVNLRHFIANHELHSNVPEVGKMEHLEELKEFHVKKESVGFELEELGKLSNLGGKLCIRNLEKVATKAEANNANLALKKNLKGLVLVWGTEQPAADVDIDVVDGLQPHDSLKELGIINHSGAIGPPSWLCRDIPLKHLESLSLKGVSWGTLPPFGQLTYLKRLVLKDISGACFIGPDPGTGRNQSFMHLKEVQISNMPVLEGWTVEPTCHLFPVLESIECSDCPNLLALPFLPDCFVSCTRDMHCPSLRSLKITECPELLLPLMPPEPSLTFMEVSDDVRRVLLMENVLNLMSYSGAIALHNMSNIVSFSSENGSITSWIDPQKATSLRVFSISEQSSIESLAFISGLGSLTSLSLINCDKLSLEFNLLITVNLKDFVFFNDERHARSVAVDLLSEVARRAKQLPSGSFQLETLVLDSILAVLVAPVCSLLAGSLHTLAIVVDQRVESLTEEEEKSLQLLTSLQTLVFSYCPCLPSLPQGLHSLPSLRKLKVTDCPEIHSLPKGGLPSSLEEIEVGWCHAELHEQVKKLQGTNPQLRVQVYP
uniref:Uncharacterized protein n=1 Tax=Avena sativa TaxID=4498 RepID=A0ACD5UJB7_AVESA